AEKESDGVRDVPGRNFVTLRQHPDQLTEGRDGNRHDVCISQGCLGSPALLGVIFSDGPHENICVGGYPRHRLPAHAFAAVSLISSIESARPFLLSFRAPKTSEIFPTGRDAFTS